MARKGWVLAVLLTLGLLGWELALLELLSGGFGPGVEVLGPRLAWDAALLLPVWGVALGCAHLLARRKDQSRTTLESAATLSLCFLLLMVPVATGRGLLQRQLAQPSAPKASEGLPVSATAQDVGSEGRFLCAAVAPDISASPEESEGGSLADAAWAGVRDALVLQVPVFPLALLLLRRRSRPVTSNTRAVVSPLALLVMLGASCSWESDGRRPPSGMADLTEAEGACAPGARVRTYAVAAASVDIPLNPHGDHVPQGLMYIVEEALPVLQAREHVPQPLVLRANVGECLVLRFTNRLATGPAALRIEGLRATVSGAGQEGGFVPGTSLPPGQSLTYVLPLPETPEAEGAYLLHDSGDGGEREVRGLFGALLLEPAGSVYRSATTGEPLPNGSGWEALIDVPTGQDFREMALLYHAMGPPEMADVRSARGELLPVQDEMAGPFRPGAFGLNYRSQPYFEREESLEEEDDARPAPPKLVAPPLLLRSYLGERIKLRLVHAGSAEFHIHHLHGWRRGQRAKQAPSSPFEAPQFLSPGNGRTLTNAGAGDFPTAAGDFIVHCHVPNHSAGGEQFTWRVFDAPQPQLAPLPGSSGAAD
ncbi:cupredoxin [Archangium lansingense]|uniref:Cupredoxin n=1 Tax=Archangium lansingense TaxID=2995310 RepID=A0ABT4AB64_9BACT|nr:cupredoxin [Archangium lansinium]MCY1078916.1 cupredoxin [Archangium lansinium]